jgi:hypothetical protein
LEANAVKRAYIGLLLLLFRYLRWERRAIAAQAAANLRDYDRLSRHFASVTRG